MSSRVAVVILNYNGKHFLEKYLPVVLDHSEGAEIIVADNASTDGSVELVRTRFPGVRLELLGENTGYAGGYNRALERVDADYYVLLNSDVEVTSGWIAPVVRLLDADLGIAACQPKIRSAARRDHFEYAGAAGGFIDSLGYPFCRGRIFDTLEADHGQYDAAGEIFWGSGACLFVRAASFRRCGGFDASFFAHMEEIDLCWRLKAAGERIWYCPDAVVYHVGGGTLPKSDARKTFLNFRNNLRMLRRNLDAPSFFRILFSRCLLDMAAAVRYLLILKPAESLAVLRAYLSLAAPAGKPGVARMTRRRFRNLTGVFSGSIVSAYYLGGKKRFTRLDEQRFASSASKGAGKS